MQSAEMAFFLAFLIGSAAADCSAVSNGSAITVGDCAKFPAVQQWVFPAAGTAGTIALKADPSYCFDFHCTHNPCFASGKYGPDAFATKCTTATPTFTVNSNKTITVAEVSDKVGKGMCVDLRGNVVVQVYPCVGSKNQQWTISSSELVSNVKTCASACTTPAPTPAPPSGFCARYHPIHDHNVYDPSGPLLDDSGLWHQWEDDGAWSHWTSTDLIHWNGSFHDSTNFGGDTGSVSPTKSGVYAFWPIMSGEDKVSRIQVQQLILTSVLSLSALGSRQLGRDWICSCDRRYSHEMDPPRRDDLDAVAHQHRIPRPSSCFRMGQQVVCRCRLR
jgi:hypothetical protein